MDSSLPSKISYIQECWSQGYLEQQKLTITRGTSTASNSGNCPVGTVLDVTSQFVIVTVCNICYTL